MIFNPTPHKIYATEEEKLYEVDNGYMVGAYRCFTASGFFRALELGVLDK